MIPASLQGRAALRELGRISGLWRYDDSADARAVGIHHIRPARWLAGAIAPDVVPAAVSESFARGGRNLQRINDDVAVCKTIELWTISGRDEPHDDAV